MDTTELLKRVERLEKQNRRMKVLGGVAIVVFLAVAAGGAPAVQEEIRAKKLVVVDDKGNNRAVLGVFDGQPTFVLLDAHRIPRVLLGAQENGANLQFFKGNNEGVCLLLNDEVGTALRFRDDNNTPRLILAVGAAPQEAVRALLPPELRDRPGPTGKTPIVGLYDHKGRHRLVLGADDDGASLKVISGSGRVLGDLGVGADDVARMFFGDNQGKLLATFPK